MLEDVIASNDVDQKFVDGLATPKNQANSNKQREEEAAPGKTVVEGTDMRATAYDIALDDEIHGAIESEIDPLNVAVLAKPAENFENKPTPTESTSDFVGHNDHKMPKDEKPQTDLELQEGVGVTRVSKSSGILERAQHPANTPQVLPDSTIFQKLPVSAGDNSVPRQTALHATNDAAGEHTPPVQIQKNSPRTHEAKLHQDPTATLSEFRTAKAHDQTALRAVFEPVKQWETIPNSNKVPESPVPTRNVTGLMQNPTEGMDDRTPKWTPAQIKVPPPAVSDATTPQTQKEPTEPLRPGVLAQNHVPAKSTQSELPSPYQNVSYLWPSRTNPDAPRGQKAFSSEEHTPKLVAPSDKPTAPSSPSPFLSQMSFPKSHASSGQEVAFDLQPSFASLGATEIVQTPKQGHSTVFQTPDLPRHVAQQMATAVRTTSDNSVAITLKPAELGRVQISMSTSEAGVVVHVIAERPETLELMRRHIDQLANEFQDIGYGQSEFRFDGAGSGERQTRDDQHSEQSGETTAPNLPMLQRASDEGHLAIPGHIDLDRVDIRI
ncbi:flagellar hook-length control protein FliK [Roseovarius rhodophyticola]|uniref:Flagellar hook-length control protein FliK n=1 Tax=Roseovarius rhodophyticola TaxID=3080827 RepID=A0ABZ2TIV4_9RHOB|nr:flagellar hook-length control protein FliK [Roseovarius sp. W115]MDV2929977.1 flagellar hook-length control protein FliK [Roseovarius sp. W115]